MKKQLLAFVMIWVVLFQVGCNKDIPVSTGTSGFTGNSVTITDKGTYYDVQVDYTAGATRREIGAELARGILEMVPNFEYLIDSYIAENLTKYEYPYSLFRVEDIKPQLDENYKEELEGMASVFSGGETNAWDDGKISYEEVYLFNLFPDIIRNSQCCYISVFGSRSSTGKNITARNLDWYSGSENQLPLLNSVMTYKYEDKQLCSIGFLGFMGIITGVNDSQIFAGIMDSQTGQPYDAAGKRSYVFDLRYAMENTATIADASAYLLDSQKHYAVNHIIILSDPDKGVVLENNISGVGIGDQRNQRAVREADSKLHDDITWGVSDSIGCVNSFLLYGNHDNHTQNKYNTLRWSNMKTQLAAKGDTVTPEELKEVITYKKHTNPGTFSESGDLYNKMTIQSMIFQPDTMELELYLHPRDTRKDPVNPVFERISLFK